MDKYIIDGVEYSYGEEVEVSDDGNNWYKRIVVGYIKGSYNPIITVCPYFIDDFKNGDKFSTACYEYIRKIQPTQSLSGRKAKLILDDGTEMNVTIE